MRLDLLRYTRMETEIGEQFININIKWKSTDEINHIWVKKNVIFD